MVREACQPWEPIPVNEYQFNMEVTRIEETTQPAPPSGRSVLLSDIVVRQAGTGALVGAWRLTFLYVRAYRMRPLNQPGNLPLTAPDDDSIFWELFPSSYLVECSAPNGIYGGMRWHHFVMRTSLDDVYEVVAHQWECQDIPYGD